jgi:hypothetical protein
MQAVQVLRMSAFAVLRFPFTVPAAEAAGQ